MEQFPDCIFDFKFDGTRITIADLLEAAGNLLGILREVDARATGEGGTLDWVIRDLDYGSALFKVAAEPRGETTPIGAPEMVVRRFKRGMRHVILTGERPEEFTEAAMRRAYDLTALLNVNGIQAFRMDVDDDEEIAITPEMRKSVKDALEGRHRALGSIEGSIDALSAHDEPYFCTVYTLLTGEAIRCYFGPALLEKVYANFRQRVIVRGSFTTRVNGEITSLRAVEIQPLDIDDIPSVDEMIGLIARSRRMLKNTIGTST
jgi:hypothetical protein